MAYKPNIFIYLLYHIVFIEKSPTKNVEVNNFVWLFLSPFEDIFSLLLKTEDWREEGREKPQLERETWIHFLPYAPRPETEPSP